MNKKHSFKVAALVIILSAILISSNFSSPIKRVWAEPNTATVKGNPLTEAQVSIKTGSEKINAKMNNNEYDNLSEIIIDDVKLHEENDYKFGGLSYSTIDNNGLITEYNLTSDVLSEVACLVHNKDTA